MELFREQRDRARSLAPEDAWDFAQFLSDLLQADVSADYFSFAMWTKPSWGTDVSVMGRAVQKACRYATRALSPGA